MRGVTVLTAFFDINRESKGDGRKLSDYLKWISKTMKLNCYLFIITENKFLDFITKNRPSEYPTFIKIDTITNAPFYKYRDIIKKIVNSETFKKKIKYPNRVECLLPEYLVIQYSKFGWLEEVAKLNPFNSKDFLWMDIGLSRFFGNRNLNLPFPSLKGLKLLENAHGKLLIQKRDDLETYPIDTDNFIWTANNLLKGGIFGGNQTVIQQVSMEITNIFENVMLEQENVNNEQLALAILWKNNKELFYLLPDRNSFPAILFSYLYNYD